MQMIHIHFYANLRTITGKSNLDLPSSSTHTLCKLLERLMEIFPEMRFRLMDEHGNLWPDVPIFVNGRNPRLTSEGINLALEPDDVISIFSPIASGRMNVEVMRMPGRDEQE